jgi:hypothetical protein
MREIGNLAPVYSLGIGWRERKGWLGVGRAMRGGREGEGGNEKGWMGRRGRAKRSVLFKRISGCVEGEREVQRIRLPSRFSEETQGDAKLFPERKCWRKTNFG